MAEGEDLRSLLRRLEQLNEVGAALSGELKSYLNKLEGIRSDFNARAREAMRLAMLPPS